MRQAGLEKIRQVKENCLLAPGGKTEIFLRDLPPAVSVGHFDAHAFRAPTISLRDRDVHGRLRVVNRAVCDQVKWTGCGCVIAEIDLNVMIARQPLKLAASEVVERLAITRAQQACYVVAI